MDGSSLPKTRKMKMALEKRALILDGTTADRSKFELPYGFGLRGIKWTPTCLAKRRMRLRELIHPDVHRGDSEEEIALWQAAWNELQEAYLRLSQSCEFGDDEVRV